MATNTNYLQLTRPVAKSRNQHTVLNANWDKMNEHLSAVTNISGNYGLHIDAGELKLKIDPKKLRFQTGSAALIIKSTPLSELQDTEITNPANNDVLRYFNGKWYNTPYAKIRTLACSQGVDVVSDPPQQGQFLRYDGTVWRNWTDPNTYHNNLADLPDTDVATRAAGQLLQYDATTQKWMNKPSNIAGFSDMDVNNPVTGEVLMRSGTKWINQPIPTPGLTITGTRRAAAAIRYDGTAWVIDAVASRVITSGTAANFFDSVQGVKPSSTSNSIPYGGYFGISSITSSIAYNTAGSATGLTMAFGKMVFFYGNISGSYSTAVSSTAIFGTFPRSPGSGSLSTSYFATALPCSHTNYTVPVCFRGSSTVTSATMYNYGSNITPSNSIPHTIGSSLVYFSWCYVAN